MDTSSGPPEDDNSASWVPSIQAVYNNGGVLSGPNVHEDQPASGPAFGPNPIDSHTFISSHTDPQLPWCPVVPTHFYDANLGQDGLAADPSLLGNAPVPYTPAAFPETPSQMHLYRFNSLFPPPHDPEHTSTGCSVTDSNVVVGEAGRTYHGYKEGAYDLPNDAVLNPPINVLWP